MQLPSRVLFVGRATLDVLYFLSALPAEDTKVYADRFHAAPGGPALNAALTQSRLNAALGQSGQTLLLAALGSDPWAGLVRAQLAECGVQLVDLAANTAFELPLATALVHSANATRTVLNPPLSTVELPPLSADFRSVLPEEWSAPPPVVLTDGFHLAQTHAFLAALQSAGSQLCLDGGSWKPGTAELAPLLTVSICSERFALPGREPDASATLAWFAAQGVPYVAVTRGPRSILALDKGRSFQVEIPPVPAVDTLGAGDVLHGAFAHFFALGLDFESALRRAAHIASQSCLHLGLDQWSAPDL